MREAEDICLSYSLTHSFFPCQHPFISFSALPPSLFLPLSLSFSLFLPPSLCLQAPLSGLTREDRKIDPTALTAYRFHTMDPIVYARSIEMRWRNGMYKNGSYAAAQTVMTSVVWTYEW